MDLPPSRAVPQNLFIGIAGWQDPALLPLLASQNSNGVLAFLARAFNLIEISSSFYQPLDLKTAQQWLALTKDNLRLRFTVRLWQKLVREHSANFKTDVHQFKAGLEPFVQSRRLGALIAPFSPAFRQSRANQDWILGLADAFAGYPFVIELHHHSWQEAGAKQDLLNSGASIAHVDQPRFGRSFIFNQKAPSRLAYLRFDGRNQATWLEANASRDQRHDYIYSAADLATIAANIKTLLGQTSACYAVFNNYTNGQALANALQLQAALTGASINAPAALRHRFPFLEERI